LFEFEPLPIAKVDVQRFCLRPMILCGHTMHRNTKKLVLCFGIFLEAAVTVGGNESINQKQANAAEDFHSAQCQSFRKATTVHDIDVVRPLFLDLRNVLSKAGITSKVGLSHCIMANHHVASLFALFISLFIAFDLSLLSAGLHKIFCCRSRFPN
jgi:hypothetical protein